MAYVYSHTRLDKNEIFYIGVGKKKNYARAYDIVTRNRFWRAIVNKTEYKVDIIFDNLSTEEARIKETELIKIYGRRDLGLGTLCNLTDGGDGAFGRIVTEETRNKISKFQKQKVYSEETIKKLKISAIKRGITSENREKMIKGREGVPLIAKRKPVIDIKTMNIFLAIKFAGEHSKVHPSHLAAMLRGDERNTTSIIYVSEYKKLLIEKINHFFPEANLQT